MGDFNPRKGVVIVSQIGMTPNDISTETVTIPAGAAGVLVNFYITKKPILDSNKSWVGGSGDTSLILTSATFTTEVSPTKADADLANGEYWVDYITGKGRGRKADTGTSMTVDYSVFLGGLAAGGTISGDLIITGDLTVQGDFQFGDVTTDALTIAGFIQGDLAGTGYVSIGTPGTSHTLNAIDDLYVAGELEVDGNVFFDLDVQIAGGADMVFGVGGANLKYNAVQTPFAFTLGVGAVSNSIIIMEVADITFDFAHPQQTNPTLFIHSADQSTVEWLSISHTGVTGGLIETGDGPLRLKPAGNIVSLFDNAQLRFGDSSDASLYYNNSQTADTLYLGVGQDSRNLLIAERLDSSFDFAHAIETNPTLFIHSANQSTTEWISFAHNQTDGVIQTGAGNLTIGSGSDSHALNTPNDLFVTGMLEVDGNTFFDGTTLFGSSSTFSAQALISTNVGLFFGGAGDSEILYSTGQTVTSLLLGVPSASNAILFVQKGDITGFDFSHAQETNPTIFIHSANQDTTQWISLTHNATSGIISSGLGGVSIMGLNISNNGTYTTLLGTAGDYNRIGDAGVTSHSLSSEDDLLITGKLEVNGQTNFDSSIFINSTSTFKNNATFQDSKQIVLGSGLDSAFEWDTGQTNDALLLGLGASRSFIVTEKADMSFNFAHTIQTNPTLFIQSANQSTTQWISFTHDQTNAVINAGTGGIDIPVRLLQTQGTDVASATNLTLPTDGNAFELTGTTQVDLILNTGWQEGAIITLIANENVTVAHGVATSGSNITIRLAGSANFAMTAEDTLILMLCSTTAGGQAWRELSRTAI